MRHDDTNHTKERLLRELWDRDERYYDLAREQVLAAAKLAGEYGFLKRWLPVRGTVLEVGCGEGSNLGVVERAGLRLIGCDLSELGVARARAAVRRSESQGESHVPSEPIELLRADAERLPFPDRSFECAFAVSLLEHLPDPAIVIEEMIRVLAPGGRLILISPQYGGPLGASPCRKSGGMGRFLRRLALAHVPGRGGPIDRRSVVGRARDRRAAPADCSPVRGLDWDRVTPLVLEGVAYDGDLDAVIEPELSSLRRFLRARGVTIEAATSGFEWHTWMDRRASLPQMAARALLEPLGRAGIPPYRDFGPLLAVAGYKDFRA